MYHTPNFWFKTKTWTQYTLESHLYPLWGHTTYQDLTEVQGGFPNRAFPNPERRPTVWDAPMKSDHTSAWNSQRQSAVARKSQESRKVADPTKQLQLQIDAEAETTVLRIRQQRP
ncbi:hypothetical protein B0H17DRAFT_1141580 [Mycena rosella]|uniref:Uncharacterized protein n=1 Tax=Mycena rosella TaxID=1033263 RepID=A0AAD7D0L2_MYCRO|nr:hypothetical protein B0H17DRAFT_1141580 [Mycena rosella]